MDKLDKLGTVTHAISPNLFHYSYAANFKKMYPNATLWGVPGLDIKKPELPIDRIIKDDVNSLWNGLEYSLFDGLMTLDVGGSVPYNEYFFFHPSSRNLIITDAAFYLDETFPILTQFIAKVLYGGYKILSPSNIQKIATKEKDKVRKSIKNVLKWNFDRVIMAHGTIVESNGKQQLKPGYEWFSDGSLN